MKAIGLVVEYNPFHNGHAYHAAESKRATGADVVIAVMSGPFLQRGEPALVNKWARTEMALSSGVDLVFELPYPFAVQSAEIFARGSITILEALQCDAFCFGSEDGRIEPFIDTYHFLKENKATYNQIIQQQIKEGFSYPRAAALAFKDLSKASEILDLSKPNNILGMEYVKTAFSLGFAIKPYTINRMSADYHDTELPIGPIASATSIRTALSANGQDLSEIDTYIPTASKDILEQYVSRYQSFHAWEQYWPYLKYQLISTTPQELACFYEMEEGIEHRMLEMAVQSATFHEFMSRMKTKRYTWTRIQRICIHLLTRTKKEDMKTLQTAPSYLRLLGATSLGRSYLHQVKKSLQLPIVSKLSAFRDPSIETDIQAARVYALGLQEPYQSMLIKREYQAPVFLE